MKGEGRVLHWLRAVAGLAVWMAVCLACPGPGASGASQGPDTVWARTYGGASADYGYSVTQTFPDGGFIIAGTTYSFGSGGYDVYVVKTDEAGDTLWARTYGGAGNDYGYSVAQTMDGGYVVAGSTDSYGAGGNDVYLVRIDSAGVKMWAQTYGGGGDDKGRSVEETPADSGFVIAGHTASYGPGVESVYLVKTYSAGAIRWTKIFGGTDWDEGRSVRKTLDGGYIIAGSTGSFGAGADDVYLVKTDSAGTAQWGKTFGGTGADYGYDVRQTLPDSGFVVVGQTYSYGTSGDVYVVKTDADGDTLWTRAIGGASIDCGYGVVQTFPDTAYLVVGCTRSFGMGGYDAYLIKLDRDGNILWTRLYGGAYNDDVYSVAQTVPDSGYIVAGSTRSFGSGSYDFYVMRSEPVLAGVDGVAGGGFGGAAIALALAPNPVRGMAAILYSIPRESHVRIAVYDVLGREVARLMDSTQRPGTQSIPWDPALSPGREIASGIYLVRLDTCAQAATAKLVFLK